MVKNKQTLLIKAFKINLSSLLIFYLGVAALPGPVRNCIARNVSASSAFVLCRPGWDGGAEQFFTLRVQNESRPDAHRALKVAANHPSTPVADATAAKPSLGAPLPLAKAAPASRPHFHLTGLRPDTLYVLNVYANNRRGRSPPTTVYISTAADVAERRVGRGGQGWFLKIFACKIKEIFDGCIFTFLFLFYQIKNI